MSGEENLPIFGIVGLITAALLAFSYNKINAKVHAKYVHHPPFSHFRIIFPPFSILRRQGEIRCSVPRDDFRDATMHIHNFNMYLDTYTPFPLSAGSTVSAPTLCRPMLTWAASLARRRRSLLRSTSATRRALLSARACPSPSCTTTCSSLLASWSSDFSSSVRFLAHTTISSPLLSLPEL
jgi:hypothetical protein